MPNKKATGKRAKTRDLFRKPETLTVNDLLAEISIGTRVQVNINSSVHSSMPNYRYQGRVGVITGKRGRAYEVELRLGNKDKTLVIVPAHLKVLKQAS